MSTLDYPSFTQQLINSSEEEQFDWSLEALEKAANYDEEFKQIEKQMSPEDSIYRRRLSSEYFILRTALVRVIFTHSTMFPY